MAYDKVIDSSKLDADLTSVADAIRAKSGTTGGLAFPDGFVSAVEEIQTESSPIIQPLSITENGTYEAPAGVDGYSPVTVNVDASGGDDSWVNRIAGSGIIKWPSGITEIPENLFYNVDTKYFVFDELPDSVEKVCKAAFFSSYNYNMNITKLPANLITLENSCFRSRQFNLSIIPAGVESIGSQAFYFNSKLKEITFRGTPTSIDINAFGQCGNLLTINAPWAEGEVENAPWGATNATINYNYVEEG